MNPLETATRQAMVNHARIAIQTLRAGPASLENNERIRAESIKWPKSCKKGGFPGSIRRRLALLIPVIVDFDWSEGHESCPSPAIANERGLARMFGEFFNTADVDQYADWIVEEVRKSLPAGYSPGTKNIADRAERLNASITKRTREFIRTTKLNIYKKARLAARVREGMAAHGYPDAFVKSFSFDLLTRLQTATKEQGR